ncbi:DUF1501 domain-containing protein [Bryobacter aggregatus]|uniref:DUF1501 domain-containing protein n=1 Tax=Bryobacter aggregatus TaxID=360054 RepID=UPI0004E1DB4D|nr:DUF1501 domain-containing protein [Bryobacter aggregatus]
MKNRTRRDFFSNIANGIHGAALASLLGAEAKASGVYDLKPKAPQFPAKAKSVIQLFMNGGPSQVDLFDPKPTLTRLAGTAPSRELSFAISNGDKPGLLMPGAYEFKRAGKCGMEMATVMPHLAECADDITLIRSMYGEHANHEPALFLMHTGRTIASRPAIGAWVAYGLGTENQNLPAYVVLDDPKGLPINGISNWQSAWLPPIYQGTRFRAEGPPVLNLEPREEIPSPLVEAERNLLRKLDSAHRERRPYQPELDARISSYELAARMQLAASDALDVNQESEATREAYGLNESATASYGKRCLMARRLVERGVRCVQLYIESQIFDSHGDLTGSLNYACGKTDKPVAALLKDLKQRGLLDSTLVVWGGEFGRLPMSQGTGKTAGRDHGPGGFSVWMAGAGLKRGYIHGATDDIGFKAVENRVSVHDFHATILHLLGMNHRDLVYERHGLSERLTDQFPARVVSEILA